MTSNSQRRNGYLADGGTKAPGIESVGAVLLAEVLVHKPYILDQFVIISPGDDSFVDTSLFQSAKTVPSHPIADRIVGDFVMD